MMYTFRGQRVANRLTNSSSGIRRRTMALKRKKLQFAAGISLILLTVSWLAYSGIQESKTYYVTVSELLSNPEGTHRRFRVAGDVADGSVKRANGHVEFRLVQEGKLLPIV